MGNKYSRGFEVGTESNDELVYPKKNNNVAGESMAHIFGTEEGEELLLPICIYPGIININIYITSLLYITYYYY